MCQELFTFTIPLCAGVVNTASGKDLRPVSIRFAEASFSHHSLP